MHRYTNDLLLKYNHASSQWETNDSQELYQHNLKTQPADWFYRDNTVRYHWNTNGYRAAEWSTIDWPSSHVVLGCSYAMGHGVDQSDTISSHVENGVNLAQSGTNITAIQYNTIRLIQHGIRPLTVKIIVPDLARLTYWGTSDWIDLTPHDLAARGEFLLNPVRECYAGWLAIDPNCEQHGYMTALGVQALWQAVGVDCELYQHWMPRNPDFSLGTQLPEPLDRARDINPNGFAHPGRDTLALWASIMYRDCK